MPWRISQRIASGPSATMAATSSREAAKWPARSVSSKCRCRLSSAPTAAWMPPSAIMVLPSPMRSLVASSTRAPARAAVSAATQPPPPPPMMSKSVSSLRAPARSASSTHALACSSAASSTGQRAPALGPTRSSAIAPARWSGWWAPSSACGSISGAAAGAGALAAQAASASAQGITAPPPAGRPARRGRSPAAVLDLAQAQDQVARTQRRAADHAAEELAEVGRRDVLRAGGDAEVAHDAVVEQGACREGAALGSQVHRLLHGDALRAGGVAAAALPAVLGFREHLVDGGDGAPAVAACRGCRRACGGPGNGRRTPPACRPPPASRRRGRCRRCARPRGAPARGTRRRRPGPCSRRSR